MTHGDGKVEGLEKPLLSHGWSAGFSFSKCHLEEAAPYDAYTPYVMGVEQFARYARFWTRGYVCPSVLGSGRCMGMCVPFARVFEG
jgi:hypothetical protein